MVTLSAKQNVGIDGDIFRAFVPFVGESGKIGETVAVVACELAIDEGAWPE